MPAIAPSRCMSTVLAALCFSVICAGCGKSAKETLAGKWVGDRLENASPGQAEQSLPWVKATTWEFAGDKVTISLPAEPPRSGTFKVSQVEGQKMKLAVARPDGQATDLINIRLDGQRTLRWNIGEQREIVFVRAE
jgi:hypothetical protein